MWREIRMTTLSGPSHTSAVLLRNAVHGDAEALGALLEKLRPWLRVLAEGMLNSRIAARLDASDVVQQTCLSVHRRLGQFEGAGVATFMAWVREIHRNNVRDEVRRHLQAEERAVDKERPLDPCLSDFRDNGSGARRSMQLGEETVFLARTMERLPPSQRKAVAMRYLEELPVSQIAVLMEISEDAVTSLLRRGLQRLREWMRESD
jgi:RNA polymerase sigma-70 factor (ECF subfamily)